jgi:hypothetical protein
MLTLCLVAVAAVLTIHWFFGRHDVTLDNACRLLAHDLRAVQNRAALHKAGARFLVDEDGWHVVDASGAPIGGLNESRPIVRRFSHDGVFEGVRIERVELGEHGAITIDARGLVTDGGELVFAFGQDSRRATVERGSGAVTVHVPGPREASEARAR